MGVVGPVVVRQLARRAQAPSASPSVHAWRDFGGQSCTAGGGQLPLLRVRASPAWGARGFISGLAPASYRQAATAVSSASEDAVAASRDGEGTAVRKQPPPKKATHQAQHHLYPRAISKAWSVKTSMKKLNTVCKLVRLAHVDAALLQLALTAKKAAKFVRKLIHEAKFNAAAMGK